MPRVVNGSTSAIAMRHRITLQGSVQGRGIRPAVARLASELGICGTVRNEMNGVAIQVQADDATLNRFLHKLADVTPVGTEIGVAHSEAEFPICTGFHIEPSHDHGPTRTLVPTDRVICDACRDEVRTRANRRFNYPFTSCTDCGPRYSILHAMPFDRKRTSMSAFVMCDACRAEYENPLDRRFHSQTNCCWTCGPRLWSRELASPDCVEGHAAIQIAVESLRKGDILAVKGIGGYQLICDAANGETVRRLRAGKHRDAKPLAVMVADIADAEAIAVLSNDEIKALTSPCGPIVVTPAADPRACGEVASVCNDLHPGLSDIGVMLPSSPIHLLLSDAVGGPLVVTSGNVGGEPLAYRADEAERQLGKVADRFLHHDRQIVRPVDDSVVRCMGGRAVSLRAARGLTPLPLRIDAGTVSLALGGQQKVSLAVANGYQCVLGPHIGDLNSLASRQRYCEQLKALCQLYACEPELTTHDAHPDYFTSQVARGSQHERIQHHHAHVVSGMLQNGWLEKKVLGLAFDGTGYGSDGSIWGGEVLLATNTSFDRVGHLRPIGLVGAEAAIADPRRIAIALVLDADPQNFKSWIAKLGFDQRYAQTIAGLLRNRSLSPVASSVGRLFDGVAALMLDDCGGRFEGEPAMRLEATCDLEERESYSIAFSNDTPTQLDWRPMVIQLLSDRERGVPAGVMAARFHRGLAAAVSRIIARYPEMPVVLSGGTFQNRVLVESILESTPADRQIALPGEIPPNDGGLAAGQLAVCAAKDTQENLPCV